MYNLYLFIINMVQNSNETYQLPQFLSLHWSFVSHKNHHEHSLSNYSLKRNKLFCEQKMHYTQLKAQLGFFPYKYYRFYFVFVCFSEFY